MAKKDRKNDRLDPDEVERRVKEELERIGAMPVQIGRASCRERVFRAV